MSPKAFNTGRAPQPQRLPQPQKLPQPQRPLLSTQAGNSLGNTTPPLNNNFRWGLLAVEG